MEESKELKQFNLAEKTAKVKILTAQTAENIIEIGRTLLEVKKNLSYGEFQNWLENEINYSKSTAYNFMKVAKEFPDFHAVGNLGMKKLLALTGIEAESREKVIANNDLDNMTVKEVEEVVKMEQQLESLNFLMEILSNEVTKTGIDYASTSNINWDIDIITGKKLTLEEVKELQEGVEEIILKDINRLRTGWYKHIDTLRKNFTDDKAFFQTFYEENIMQRIHGDINGDIDSKFRNIYWNIMLIDYFRNKGVEQ